MVLNINGVRHEVTVDPDVELLTVLREYPGTNYRDYWDYISKESFKHSPVFNLVGKAVRKINHPLMSCFAIL